MKQRLVPLLLCLLLMCALALPALGAADQQDPVIAKSYLDKVATTDLKDAVNGAATRAMNAAYGRKLLALTEAVGDYRLQLAQKDTGNRFACSRHTDHAAVRHDGCQLFRRYQYLSRICPLQRRCALSKKPVHEK